MGSECPYQLAKSTKKPTRILTHGEKWKGAHWANDKTNIGVACIDIDSIFSGRLFSRPLSVE